MSYAEFLVDSDLVARYRKALEFLGVDNPSDRQCYDAYQDSDY